MENHFNGKSIRLRANKAKKILTIWVVYKNFLYVSDQREMFLLDKMYVCCREFVDELERGRNVHIKIDFVPLQLGQVNIRLAITVVK